MIDISRRLWNKSSHEVMQLMDSDLTSVAVSAVTQVELNQQVLRTDVAGMPVEWIDYRDAVRLYHTGQVAYTCGELLYVVHGGINALTGELNVL